MRRPVDGPALLRWYDARRRDLPWRRDPAPYRTWISEIMLQQTQVSTALPYYQRFLRRFPDVQTLARAPEEEVLRHWAGLGYYSRARNLRKAALEIVERHGGEFPRDFDAALALPGIGRYTAGAILSIACGKPYPVVDGNVARVFARLFGIKKNVKDASTQRELWTIAERLLVHARPGDWNQALMELGATVCLPESPRCGDCPLAAGCLARRRGWEESLPNTGRARAPVKLDWTFLWLEKGGRLLLWKRSEEERFLPGHWSLPEPRHLGRAVSVGASIRKIRHTITHHHITADLRRARITGDISSPNAKWTPKASLEDHLISSLWRKALVLNKD